VSGPWHTLADLNAVAGWLLWSHRMASEFGGMTGRTFAAAARERGVSLSETEVSRAESGEGDVAITAVPKYERVLGMQVGALSAPLRSAARLAPGLPGADRLRTLRSVPKSVDVRQEVVNDAYVRWSAGEHLTGSDWLQLVDAITYDKQSLLPDALASEWIRQLLDEGMRSVNAAYFARIEALSVIAGHDHYALHLLAATRELTSVAGASGTADAWAVIGDMRSPAVRAALLAELPSVPDERLFLHGIALVTPMERGDLTPAQHQAIAQDLERRLARWTLQSYEPIATIAAELPEALGGPILRAIDRGVHPMSRLTGHREHRDVGEEIEIYTRAAMARTWPDHPTGSVLPELLRLVLSSESFSVRHHAASLIFCSPFTASICEAAADLALSASSPPTRQLATYLVSRLGTRENAERLRLLLKQARQAGLVTNTLTTMAHAGILTDQDDLTEFMRNEKYRYTGIYAAGITGHPDLYSADADSDWASWWRAKGGGVRV